MDTLQSQIKSVMRQVQAATVQASQIEQLKTEVTRLEKELSTLERRLYPREEVPAILRRLVKLGERYRLRFSAVYPMYEQLMEETATDGSPLLILPVDIQLSGEFFQFGRYIEQLDRQPFLFSVEQVDMVVTRASYPLIEVTVRGNLFFAAKGQIRKDHRVGEYAKARENSHHHRCIVRHFFCDQSVCVLREAASGQSKATVAENNRQTRQTACDSR
ncbi:MAG: type 4a pilus biogenesis protein PilO [candidate division KSB1 bacterium]|nr:type 4a pilus biogenesis protein PilO [candidate division KSB1 bacterium]